MKTLIRTPNHLGDCLMALPAITAASELFPSESLYLLAPDWAVSLYRHLDKYELIPLEKNQLHGPRAIMDQSDLIGKDKFDRGILLTPSFSSALVFLLSGVKERFGYPDDHRGYLLNRPVARDTDIKHRGRQYHHLIQKATGKNAAFANPEISPGPDDRTVAASLLKGNGPAPGDNYIVIAAQAVAPSRRWGEANYGALSARLIDETGLAVVLVGTESERDAGDNIASGRGRVINLCGRTDIATAAAVMARAKLFIGNDSGLAHLAAAVGIPLVVLSGADSPDETSPLSDKKTVIIKEQLDCISCVKNDCPEKGKRFMRCMTEISVDEVYMAALKYFKE